MALWKQRDRKLESGYAFYERDYARRRPPSGNLGQRAKRKRMILLVAKLTWFLCLGILCWVGIMTILWLVFSL